VPERPVTPTAEELVYESDWLASRPFFYNVKTGAASANINDLIDLENVELDPEGFNDYLDFGFSVFEHTPVRDVRILRYSSRLYRGPQGLRVEYLDDPAEQWYDRHSTVNEVLELADVEINAAAAAATGDLVVPTSGGFDSRLINFLLSDRSRVRAFTYGVSDDPLRSTEVVKAHEVARRLGLHWQTLPLGQFHRYLGDWDALYGVSTHAHGMYQMEFYDQVKRYVAPGSTVLSGICGEWFSGDDKEVRTQPVVDRPDDFVAMMAFSPMCGDSHMSNFRSDRLGAQRALAQQPRLREEILPRVVTVVRLDMAYLSYLTTLPIALGLKPQAPYLTPGLALRLLTLPDELRHKRRWVREVFASHDLDLETSEPPSDHRNTLNFRAMRAVPLAPLDGALLREVVRPDYVRWINRAVGTRGLPWELYWRLGWTPGFRRTVYQLQQMGAKDQRLPAYGAYLTLWPIQQLLRRRDAARGGEAQA
jgi:hypothetical protein